MTKNNFLLLSYFENMTKSSFFVIP